MNKPQVVVIGSDKSIYDFVCGFLNAKTDIKCYGFDSYCTVCETFDKYKFDERVKLCIINIDIHSLEKFGLYGLYEAIDVIEYIRKYCPSAKIVILTDLKNDHDTIDIFIKNNIPVLFKPISKLDIKKIAEKALAL